MMGTTTDRHSDVHLRQRRVGKKALQSDRISKALGMPVPAKPKGVLHRFNMRPRTVAISAAVVLVVLVAGTIGSKILVDQAAAAEKVQLAEQQKITKRKDDAARACRLEKATQKSDLIGRVTFDELYDKNECNK